MNSTNLALTSAAVASDSQQQATADSLHAVLQLIDSQHPNRQALQYFIAQGFARHYQATVSQFMPYLVGVQQAGAFQAALGIRFARQHQLFTEQYLPSAAELVLQQQGIVSWRAGIAEIGHLYAESAVALMQLFVLTVQALHQLNIRHLVFAATADLQRMLQRHGLKLSVLAKADPSHLGDKAKDWGSYYLQQPQVCVLSLPQAAERIHGDNRLQQLIFRHWPQLHSLVDTLKESV
ncbi:MAG: thermostable hemolysin [Gammaproteobacteria bacterium]|nr:thermostable hemolysin [Gammaproteobacteria bacterium]MBU1554760.1 thermostable hemolysin [Gammaproteobacteria bacterium]MBU2071826.1 thermostable hemolysin [Gammaproteobacteria bacterium]MBU2181905.1 thermostable hemolysin [Gammaproteobacteria bacterium]MBU2205460.1 thermostable hemolysin [Gammaproteobacteria bacterium]